MRVAWNIPRYQRQGNGYGYATVEDGLRRHMPVDWSEDADVALTLCPPDQFEPVAGKRNVLFTMFEAPEMPALARECLNRADLIVAPSEFNRRIFLRYTDKPVLVCPLGVEPLPVVARHFHLAQPERPFRFLYVGAANWRKGLLTVAHCWQEYFAATTGAELYIKTTMKHGAGTLTREGSVIMDTRNVSREELTDLYGAAHCFLFPTVGEGFGYTLAEALSGGLPALATAYGGHLEFATARNTVLLPYMLDRCALEEGASDAPDGKFTFAIVPSPILARAMVAVMRDYPAAVALAAEGAKHIRRAFSWQACTERLIQILTDQQRRVDADRRLAA